MAALVVVMILMQGCSHDSPCIPCEPDQCTGNPVVVIETTMGDMTIELFARESPISVGNFLLYVHDDFYDGLIFHRVIRNFIIQAGQYDENLQIKPARDPIPCEADNGLSNKRGTIAMARTIDINSATSQFFINVRDNPALDHNMVEFGYAVFGRVIAGLSVVDSIEVVETTNVNGFHDVPVEPVIISDIRRLQ